MRSAESEIIEGVTRRGGDLRTDGEMGGNGDGEIGDRGTYTK